MSINTCDGWEGREYYVESIDQSLLRDGVETFRASAVISEPYVMANKTLAGSIKGVWVPTDNFDRVDPSHWMNTSRSFAVLVGKSPASFGL